MIKKLTRTEYFDVYGIELMSWNVNLSETYILSLLLPIAKKYLEITKYAVRSELRHFPRGAAICDVQEYDARINSRANKDLLKDNGIPIWNKKVRLSLDLDNAERLFMDGCWEDGYGGVRWGSIAMVAWKLEKAIEDKNLRDIIYCLDNLNDMEHNTSLYLSGYTTFDFEKWSNYRACEPDTKKILELCSDQVRELEKFKK